MSATLSDALAREIAAIPHRPPRPLPYSAEAHALDAARVRADDAARRLAVEFSLALSRGAVVVSGSAMGEAVERWLDASAEERKAAEAIRSPRTGTGKSNSTST